MPSRQPPRQIVRFVLKPIVFIACLIPALQLLAGALGKFNVDLGADPAAEILHSLGLWGLRFVVITLCVTPARLLLNQPWLHQFRRMLGLYAFTYVLLHFMAWLALDQQFYWAGIGEDLVKRPYITLGFIALLMLLALAITSTRGMMRRLGKRWQQLHRLVYVIAVLGVWHFWWQVKADIREPLIYAVIVGVLLGYRLWRSRMLSRLTMARKPT